MEVWKREIIILDLILVATLFFLNFFIFFLRIFIFLGLFFWFIGSKNCDIIAFCAERGLASFSKARTNFPPSGRFKNFYSVVLLLWKRIFNVKPRVLPSIIVDFGNVLTSSYFVVRGAMNKNFYIVCIRSGRIYGNVK